MPVQIQCPNAKCGAALSLADDLAGRSARCPSCNATFRVPPSTDGSVSQSKSGVAVQRDVSDPNLPVAIGPYSVRRKLGAGAFGIVYQGFDPSLRREVAIKVLRSQALSAKHIERFKREAQVVAGMHHGNIVPVFQLGEYENALYIVSGFINGQPLSAAVTEEGLEPERAVRLVLQLLEALAYAHERGVMHRDVKPANAMLDDKDTLYLMDFGLAGLVGQDESRMTQDGAVMGTPSYMPPEQAKGEIRRIGPASDQYSAGVVFYELLTGCVPFEAPSIAALIYMVISTPPPPPSATRKDLDPLLEQICLKALAKEPEQRFASCRAFAAELQNWLDSKRQGSGRASTVTTSARQQRKESPSVAANTASSILGRSTVVAPAARQTAMPTGTPVVVESPAPEPAAGRSLFLVLLLLFAVGLCALPIIAVGGYVAVGKLMSKDAPKGGGYRDDLNKDKIPDINKD